MARPMAKVLWACLLRQAFCSEQPDNPLSYQVITSSFALMTTSRENAIVVP